MNREDMKSRAPYFAIIAYCSKLSKNKSEILKYMRVAPYNCMWVLNLFNEESTVYEQVCYMYTCI